MQPGREREFFAGNNISDIMMRNMGTIADMLAGNKRLLQRIQYYAPVFYDMSEQFFSGEKGVLVSDIALWLLAQGIAESRLNHKAKSPVGACGIMQLLPDTFTFINAELNLGLKDIWNPRDNIVAGVGYDYWLYKRLRRYLKDQDYVFVLQIVFAEYNWRLGLYSVFRNYIEKGILPMEQFPEETQRYIKSIREYHLALLFCDVKWKLEESNGMG